MYIDDGGGDDDGDDNNNTFSCNNMLDEVPMFSQASSNVAGSSSEKSFSK